MLLAEDYLLLMMDDESGRPIISGEYVDIAVAGALLSDMVAAGLVRITEKGESGARAQRVVVEAPPFVEEPLFRHGIERLAKKPGCKPVAAVNVLKKGLRTMLLERLAGEGYLQREDDHVLGFIPWTRWRAIDGGGYETTLRERLDAVLIRHETPTDHDGALIALLSATDSVVKVIGRDGQTIDKRAVKKRAKELKEQYWAANAAFKAIQEAQAAAAAAASAGAAGA